MKKVSCIDIKPSNILITSSGKVKLVDFGLAKSEHQGITVTGEFFGTPSYISPEQIRHPEKRIAGVMFIH